MCETWAFAYKPRPTHGAVTSLNLTMSVAAEMSRWKPGCRSYGFYRVPARSIMRFRQTGAVTVDGARLDDDGPRGSWLAWYHDGDSSFVDGKLYQLRCSLLYWRSASSSRLHDRLRLCGSRPDCSCSSILTNQSTDERAQSARLGAYARFALISAHITVLSHAGCRIVSLSDGVKRHRPVVCQPAL